MNKNIQICNKLTASKWRCLFPTEMDAHIAIAYTEEVVDRCSLKKVFLKISHISLENTCVGISF